MPTETPELPATPEDLIAAAKRLRLEASVLAAQAAAKVSQAQAYEHLAGLKEAAASPLTPTGTIGTMGTNDMEAQTPSHGANISAAKTKSKAPFRRALAKRNLSLPEWARAQKKPALEVETAKSWTKKPGHGGRPCPRLWADKIEAEFVDEKGKTEVPATAASWPNGIRE